MLLLLGAMSDCQFPRQGLFDLVSGQVREGESTLLAAVEEDSAVRGVLGAVSHGGRSG